MQSIRPLPHKGQLLDLVQDDRWRHQLGAVFEQGTEELNRHILGKAVDCRLDERIADLKPQVPGPDGQIPGAGYIIEIARVLSQLLSDLVPPIPHLRCLLSQQVV